MRIHELGHIVFYVSNLTQSADFYKNILGFTEIHRSFGMAIFSSGRTHHELLLIEVGGEKQQTHSPSPGFYHVGFKIGNTDRELREAVSELQKNGVYIIGATNHHVTHSIYILDPDSNEIELYVDINDGWKNDPSLISKPPERLTI